MPYSYHKDGDKYVVTKKDTGKEVGRTKGTKEALKKYLAALHINANEGKTNTMKKSELTKMIQEVIKEVISEQMSSNKITEAYVPDNIKKFAKRKGVSSLVNTVASWAEKAGKRITGGTAIGKDYSTLILDMGYQTADIYIDTEEGTIELYGEPVRNFNEFKKVWLDQMTADEMEKDDNQFRRETGVDESADYDTAVAFRLVAKDNREAALAALQTEINKITGVGGRFSKVKVTVIPSKGNPQDIIIKLNGPSAFSMGKDITAKDKTKAYTNPVIRNNFSKVSPYTPQLTKI
jgi:ribosomal protein L17